MRLRILAIFFYTIFTHAAFAQNQHQLQKFARKAQVNVQQITEDYSPYLQNLEMPKPGADSYYNYLQRVKAQIKPNRQKDETKLGELENALVKSAGFEVAATSVGVPNDNDMAISNDGKVVAVLNGSFMVTDTLGKVLKNVSLEAFSTQLNLKQQKYDPRVLYDPEKDRFVVVILNGSNDSTNFIVVAFSQTNDPAGVWNLYTLPGNPLDDATWSDYPIIALHNGELFLTINSLQNNKSWQEGFKQSYIWEIDKNLGYDGKELATKIHDKNAFDGRNIRNLCPVQGGSKLATGTAYFVSTRNFASQSDSVFLISLEGNIYSTNQVKNIKLIRAAGTYGVPPSARQIRDSFQTNDARILDAVMENNTIHFVGNSVTPGGKAGVYHGVITNYTATPQAEIKVISHDKLEFGYPSIAYAGRSRTEDAFLIFFNHTADTIAAGNSAVLYNGGLYSDVIRLKEGTSYVNVMSGRQERWGDYSGAQTRYNQPGNVWVCGYYGFKKNIGGGSIQNQNGTYIGAVKNTSTNFPSSIIENQVKRVEAPVVFPSPAQNTERINVEFTVENEAFATFQIYDMQGKMVKLLLNDKVKIGKNKFSFSPQNMKAGQYILRINQQGNDLSSVKFMVR